MDCLNGDFYDDCLNRDFCDFYDEYDARLALEGYQKNIRIMGIMVQIFV